MVSNSSFQDAGSDDDLRAAFQLSRWSTRREAAQAGLSRSRDLLAQEDRAGAEAAARDALETFRSALNWAEFGPDEEQAHRELDDAGGWVRRTFRCRLTREGTHYEQTCPVALGHNRVGLSVGGVATRVCSICGEDLSECPHMRGRAYLVPGGVGELGWCRVCASHDGCDHRPDQEYRASVISIITKMDLEEVSFVSRPAHPDARLSSVPISHEDLSEALGPEFTPGIEVSCDRCLMPCDGLVRPEIPHG
jgi:hypothetical protein